MSVASQNNMLLGFFLLISLCNFTVGQVGTIPYWTTTYSATTSTHQDPTTSGTTEEMLPPLQLVATPDYPVAAGQSVNLHCSTLIKSNLAAWSWGRQEKNQTWTEVGNERDLILTKPEDSGVYQCSLQGLSKRSVSPPHTVLIISIHATAGEKLGVAAFVLSLLALIISIALLIWLIWRRPSEQMTISNTAAQGFPRSEKSPKGDFPKTDIDGDVYMNYTSGNQAYTDLDPTNMTTDNVYSSLS